MRKEIKFDDSDIKIAYKYAKDGAIQISTNCNKLSNNELKMKHEMITTILNNLGYKFISYFGGTMKNRKSIITLSYIINYPNSKYRTFRSVVSNVQNMANAFDFDCILLDKEEYFDYCKLNLNRDIA